MSIKKIATALTVGLAIAAAVPAMAQQRGQGAAQRSRSAEPAGTPASSSADRDRERAADRLRDRDTLHLQDRDRLQDADIYGSALMTPSELSQYRDHLQSTQTDRQWAEIRAQHQEEMLARARQSGAALQAPVYGQFMMTAREQQRYRDRVQSARNPRRQAKVRAEYQAEMQKRAQRLGVQLPSPVFGQQMMTAEEQARYRERLQSMSNEAERQQFMAEHREQMQARAREHRISLD